MSAKILIIEDDPSAARLAGFALLQEGFDVVTASNGLEGLDRAKEEKPDLIILDYMMPFIDGNEVCVQLRADPDTANVPILMLSAKFKQLDKVLGRYMGVTAHMAKPTAPADIVKMVKQLLAQGAGPLIGEW